MNITFIPTVRALNPTSIDIGEYVINAYRGCSYGCVYCYVPYNKSILKMNKKWGTFVGVRKDLPLVLEKEIDVIKPQNVLIGSTCESFMPLEKEYKITEQVLRILNKKKVYYSILTRSPLILDSIDLLIAGYCKMVYFTTNNYSLKVKELLEPFTPGFKEREKAIISLYENNINVIPYICPLIPGLTDIDAIFNTFSNLPEINFEALNFNLGNIEMIISLLMEICPDLGNNLNEMMSNKIEYTKVWESLKNDILFCAGKYSIRQHFYLHELNAYFENKY
ncbi:MAG: radical SAM protein [Candidatus Omnitrophica bacterium]|nr:radical SAM protein [Candidatus Omnitrophota bacterium]